jgi:hypothetical protein
LVGYFVVVVEGSRWTGKDFTVCNMAEAADQQLAAMPVSVDMAVFYV